MCREKSAARLNLNGALLKTDSKREWDWGSLLKPNPSMTVRLYRKRSLIFRSFASAGYGKEWTLLKVACYMAYKYLSMEIRVTWVYKCSIMYPKVKTPHRETAVQPTLTYISRGKNKWMISVKKALVLTRPLNWVPVQQTGCWAQLVPPRPLRGNE